LPLFIRIEIRFGGFMPAPLRSAAEGYTNLRKIALVAAIAGAALSLAACSEGTEEAAGEAADSAMADAEANADAAGAVVEDAASEAGAAVDAAGEATDEAGTEVEADVQDESKAEAAAD
jgi:hypothetical protein